MTIRTNRSILSLTIWLLSVLAVSAVSVAQEAADKNVPEFGDEIDVTEVSIDVRVTDRFGNAVLGLAPSDFSVTENGVPMNVVGVNGYSTRNTGSADRNPDSRFIMLVVHTPLGTEFERTGAIRRRLQMSRDLSEWLESGPGPSDWIAVVSYQTSLSILQDFTQDREALRTGIENAGRGKRAKSGPWRQGDGSPWELSAELPRDRELIRASTNIYDALGLLADASGRIVGRKILVLYSPGFGDLDNTSQGMAWPDRRRYDELIAKLDDNNVSVFPVDTTPTGIKHSQSATLQQIASDTGGDFAPYVERFAARMEDIAVSNVAYYMVSYQVQHTPQDEGFREVEVEVANPNLKVVARPGYFYLPEGNRRR